jgi:heme A synthase
MIGWLFVISVVAFAVIYACCKCLDERDEAIDRTEYARLRGWASLIIAGVLGQIYLGFTIFGKG